MEKIESMREPCDLLGGKAELARRIVQVLGHRPEIRDALEKNQGDPIKAIATFTRGDILRMCYLDEITLEDLTGPIQWQSEEEQHHWEQQTAENIRIVDTVSLGDALAASQFPHHPDLIGCVAPPIGEDASSESA